MTSIKQVIIIRSDLNMGKGKIAAQTAHASLTSYFISEGKDLNIAKEWLETGQKKVVLKIAGEKEILELYKIIKTKKIPCAIIKDAGLTQIPSGSVTALGIGPWEEEAIDKITKDLKLL